MGAVCSDNYRIHEQVQYCDELVYACSPLDGGETALPEEVHAQTMAVGWRGLSMEEARQLAETGTAATGDRALLTKTPHEVLSDLQRGNRRFWMGAAERPERRAFQRRALMTTRFPSVAILGCSDSRVPVEIIFDVGLGDIFVIHVAGNCLEGSSLASLQYAVHHLKVKVLLVLGHEGCAAVKLAALPAAQTEDAPEPDQAWQALRQQLKLGLQQDHLAEIRDARAQQREAAVADVKQQLALLASDDSILQRIEEGELLCLGGFYTMSSGIVDFFSELITGGANGPAHLPFDARCGPSQTEGVASTLALPPMAHRGTGPQSQIALRPREFGA
eukprot:TRINITY_DN116499_c0_g1_i1.p1 TRINITY_DN116499_c0_g1~~TRINITY_DN116499_c0_g1_i1.p1  ORF type:complete len:332 (+),score=67.62 TRINITY_DN116499_c0_g1_i1:71-1066(+)